MANYRRSAGVGMAGGGGGGGTGGGGGPAAPQPPQAQTQQLIISDPNRLGKRSYLKNVDF